MNRHFPRLFLWHAARDLARHRVLSLLTLLSIALGVAVCLAVQIASHSAARSFEAGVDVTAGRANLELRGDIPDTLLPSIAAEPGVRAATPLVEGVVTLPDFPGEYLRLLGLDVFTNEPFRTFDTQRGIDLQRWLGDPRALAISEEFAARHQLRVGEKIRVLVDARVEEMRIIGLLDPGVGGSQFAAMDIAAAQELLGMVGKLSSIQVLLREPEQAEQMSLKLTKRSSPGVSVSAPAQRSFQMQTMLSAFRLNLTALSMVSLLVGMFLVHNAVSASVARRRVEIGILRALGTTRGEVRALFLGQAALLGLLGAALGSVAGIAFGRILLGTVARTISSLYVLVSIDRAWLSPWLFALTAALGLASALLAAWWPASEAARIEPAQALSPGTAMDRAARAAPRTFWIAAGMLGLSGICSWLALSVRLPWMGFGAAFFVLIGFSFLSPAACLAASALARHCTAWSLTARLAAENLARSLRRNSTTVAALAAAIAMMIGVSVMIHSFRESVESWVTRSITADLFIAPASNEVVGLSAYIPPEAKLWLEARPEVRAVDTYRELRLPWRGQPISLAVVTGLARRQLTHTGPEIEAVNPVRVSESFAHKHDLKSGEIITLETPRGPVVFTIAGVYLDYTSDAGVVLIERELFDSYWNDPRVQSLAVYLNSESDLKTLTTDFRSAFSRAGEFGIYPNRDLRERILGIFDQTFAVTHLLRVIAIIVAVAGVFLSMTTLVTERARDIGVLRAIGASRAQIARTFLAEAGYLGAISSFLGIAAGCALAVVLTWVINRAFFGWTIQLLYPWPLIAATPLWIIPSALFAALWPALTAARLPIATTIREE